MQCKGLPDQNNRPLHGTVLPWLNPLAWDLIFRFLVVRSRPQPSEWEYDPQLTGNASAMLELVLRLRLTCKELAEHFGPANQTFWRGFVLLCFDFTVDPKPVKLAEGHFEFDRLDEEYRCWSALDVRFRPSQYQFLSEILCASTSLPSWPEHEDALSLFADLVFVTERFGPLHGQLDTRSDGQAMVDPVLLSAIPADAVLDPEELRDPTNICPEEYNPRVDSDLPYHPLFAHCGLPLLGWKYADGKRTSKKWVGLRDHDAANGLEGEEYEGEDLVCDELETQVEDERAPGFNNGGIDSDENDDSEEEDEQEEEEKLYPEIFPSGYRSKVQLLQRMVKTHCSDWREVTTSGFYLNDIGGPVFYVGKSKASSRWVGFAGRSQY